MGILKKWAIKKYNQTVRSINESRKQKAAEHEVYERERKKARLARAAREGRKAGLTGASRGKAIINFGNNLAIDMGVAKRKSIKKKRRKHKGKRKVVIYV